MTKILVVEDNLEIRGNVVDLLEAEDFEVMEAENGLKALELLAEDKNFELIICDVMMPEMDGHGLLQNLRQNPATANIPFIFLTAKGERSDIREGMNLGADDYLSKPFTNKELIEAIQARLDRSARQKQQLEKAIEELALDNLDSLTGLPGQSALEGEDGYFERAIASRDGKSLLPFLLLGLDGFARINYAIGYSNGDIILQQVAERLKNFTENLVAIYETEKALVRLSGDEFAILLPPTDRQSGAVALAEKLLKVITQPFDANGKSIPLTGTIGMAFYPQAPSLEELRRQASVAMGEAKRAGGNRCQIYSPRRFGVDASKEELQLASLLRRVWEGKQFKVLYQPRVDIRKRKTIGVGAVVHWEDPRKGPLSSEKILAVAEESGFALELNQWIWEAACEQAKVWQKSRRNLQVAVGLSAQFFAQANAAEIIEKIIEDFGVDPGYLVVEVAADTIANAQNVNGMAAKLIAFQKLGLKTTINNFGIGHSTLNYLEKLPLNNLKLDRSLVLNTSQNAPIIGAIVEMARGMKLRTIADGVETEEQVKLLKKQKCDEIQNNASFSPAEISRITR
ncbi:MAG: EAL domain-containing protein [Oscillatoria sp. SIO1A7]|nr:EAL domain-containing protein [Oscillatoria sp. SIO1A7]